MLRPIFTLLLVGHPLPGPLPQAGEGVVRKPSSLTLRPLRLCGEVFTQNIMTTRTLPAYAELQCASNFSFLRGASHPEELAARAAELGYAALAITDECSLGGVVHAHIEAKKQGLNLIMGRKFQLHNEDRRPDF